MRSLLTQACCVAGGVVGLWLGFFAALEEIAPADTMLVVGWHVVSGVAAGALCAWAVTVGLPKAWARRR
jgi:hypothetical protein